MTSYPVEETVTFQKNSPKMSSFVATVYFVLRNTVHASGYDYGCFKIHKLMLQIHKGQLDLSWDAPHASSEGGKVLKRDKYHSFRREMYVIKRNVSKNTEAICQRRRLTDGREEGKMFYHVRQGVLFEI